MSESQLTCISLLITDTHKVHTLVLVPLYSKLYGNFLYLHTLNI